MSYLYPGIELSDSLGAEVFPSDHDSSLPERAKVLGAVTIITLYNEP
jgi:hypothetical protein